MEEERFVRRLNKRFVSEVMRRAYPVLIKFTIGTTVFTDLARTIDSEAVTLCTQVLDSTAKGTS